MKTTDVRYCFRTAAEMGVGSNPKRNIEALAIAYGFKVLKDECVPQADCWVFRLYGELPINMPDYLQVLPQPYWKDVE